MNLQKMMKQAQEMQTRLQQELSTLEVEAQVGGGMVGVKMSGHKKVLAIEIDPEAIDPEDREMLQDLILSAVNEATRKVDEELQSRLGGLTSGLPGMPG